MRFSEKFYAHDWDADGYSLSFTKTRVIIMFGELDDEDQQIILLNSQKKSCNPFETHRKYVSLSKGKSLIYLV